MTDLDHAKIFLEVIPRTQRMVRTEIRKIAGDRFTIPQYRLLAKISKQSWSNHELAEWMGVTAPTMSKMVDKLVERGLASRSGNGFGQTLRRGAKSADRRQVSICATSRGGKQVGRIKAVVQRIFARRIARLKAGRKRELLAGLEILKELSL